ncbi:hypothetical protein G6F62_014470 [Rhizopus arrhizus]|nr:hypothetical protein G6F62_014470 [Rhizopus arrhizus]
MAAKVATSATTSTAPTMSVADSWRRNRPITSTPSTMVSTRVASPSCSEARMVRVRSLSTSTATLAGRLARSSGSPRPAARSATPARRRSRHRRPPARRRPASPASPRGRPPPAAGSPAHRTTGRWLQRWMYAARPSAHLWPG